MSTPSPTPARRRGAPLRDDSLPRNDRASPFSVVSRLWKRARLVRDAFPPAVRRSLGAYAARTRRRLALRVHDAVTDSDSASDTTSADSDLESLPDLTDDASVCLLLLATTPTKPLCLFFADAPSAGRKVLFPYHAERFVFGHAERPRPLAAHTLFAIPELVCKIVTYADMLTSVVPREKAPVRRKPLSMEHALLLHDGNAAGAARAMAQLEPAARPPSAMHSCLLVNKLFYRITKEIMGSRVHFASSRSFARFVLNRPEFFHTYRPTTVVLDKLFHAKQALLDRIAHVDYTQLQWLEIFMCPKLLPAENFFHALLRTLIVAGSKVLDDALLTTIAARCPSLEVLDIRACEGVTDYGVYSVASKCKKLTSVNLGRKKKGHLITDHSVCALVGNNPNLHTVGLAGCYVTDRLIWELAMSCGRTVERLLLNSCPYITNQLVPVVLHHNLLPRLTVLEVRFISKLTNMEPLITFQRRQSARGVFVLVETCEELLVRMRECEQRMDSRILERIFQDISEWANAKDDDTPHGDLILSRRQFA